MRGVSVDWRIENRNWEEALRKERAKRLRAQRPCGGCALFQLCRKVFEASRLNLCERVDPALFLGKRNLRVSLWKAVHDCAKSVCRNASRVARFPTRVGAVFAGAVGTCRPALGRVARADHTKKIEANPRKHF